jgi:hypothetical protein
MGKILENQLRLNPTISIRNKQIEKGEWCKGCPIENSEVYICSMTCKRFFDYWWKFEKDSILDKEITDYYDFPREKKERRYTQMLF